MKTPKPYYLYYLLGFAGVRGDGRTDARLRQRRPAFPGLKTCGRSNGDVLVLARHGQGPICRESGLVTRNKAIAYYIYLKKGF